MKKSGGTTVYGDSWRERKGSVKPVSASLSFYAPAEQMTASAQADTVILRLPDLMSMFLYVKTADAAFDVYFERGCGIVAQLIVYAADPGFVNCVDLASCRE